MSILVQWTEVDGGERSGEMLMPSLPVPSQHITFGHITNADRDAVEFLIETATWNIDNGIVEGYITVSRTTG